MGDEYILTQDDKEYYRKRFGMEDWMLEDSDSVDVEFDTEPDHEIVAAVTK